ncbi:MAG: hypothetical protein ACNA8P_12755 [Phycisphaerales bacterium]
MPQAAKDRAATIHKWTTRLLQTIMIIAAALAVYEQQWLNAAIVAAIFFLCALPGILGRRMKIYIPPEFELMAIVFIFASLFLGEVGDYYQRFWWWDVALHTSSGLLLGILGFLLVYVLNSQPNIRLSMSPAFIALFALVFAVAVGAIWEIFEFTMDSLFGTNMQKPMLGDESGLTDTMFDLIVDTVGATIIAAIGYIYMKQDTPSFIERWIKKFVDANPRFFTK